MAQRRINLLPPDLAQRRRVRQVAAALVAAGLGLVVILGVVYVVQEVRLRGERGRLATRQERVDALRAQISELEEIEERDEALRDKASLIEDLTAGEVRWSVVLADIGIVIPSDVWLTQFTGSVGGGDEEDEEATVRLGTLTLNGTSFSHPDVARWLTRLGGVDGFTFPYLSLSSRSAIGETPIVNFNSTVQLASPALRRNQRGAGRRV